MQQLELIIGVNVAMDTPHNWQKQRIRPFDALLPYPPACQVARVVYLYLEVPL